MILSRARNEKEGFSLPEILATITIIAVLSAIAIPTFFQSRDATFQNAIEADALRAVVPMSNYAQYLNADPAVTFTVGGSCSMPMAAPAELAGEIVVLEADCLTIKHIHNGFTITATDSRYSGSVTYSSSSEALVPSGEYR